MGILLILILAIFVSCLRGFYLTKDNKRDENGHVVRDEKGYNVYEYERKYDFTNVFEYVWSGATFILSAIILFCSIFGMLVTHIGAYGRYEVQIMKQQVIEYRLDRIEEGFYEDFMLNGEIGTLESTYSDLIEFNATIIPAKTYGDSFWIGWFYNQYYKDIELITLEPLE
jgi:hypothetical protein